MKSLYEHLIEYSKDNYYPMHMPGHKRNTKRISMENCYEMDITEIDGFDNLFDPVGILKDAMDRAARIYRSKKTYFLVNGSTVGILAGICACTNKGDQVLMARNCHKSVYNGIFLNELKPFYLYPQTEETFGINGGISPKKVEEMLITYPNIKMIIITSPTYEGIVSNVKEISKIAKKWGVPFLVDEAHGAHFGFHQGFPKNSIENGADIVIHSVHKTLPAFTQSALMHVNSGIVELNKIDQYLSIYQSSSPSYLLMASIDKSMEFIEEEGDLLFNDFSSQLDWFYKKMQKLENLRVFRLEDIEKKLSNIYDFDESKIVISTKNVTLTGKELYDILLKKYKIQLEMASKDYVIAMTSIFDTQEGFKSLKEALLLIDKNLSRSNSFPQPEYESLVLDRKLTSYEAYQIKGEGIPLSQSAGRVGKEYVYLYPPGIPLLVPGEVINKEWIKMIESVYKQGLNIKGLMDANMKYIEVIQGM